MSPWWMRPTADGVAEEEAREKHRPATPSQQEPEEAPTEAPAEALTFTPPDWLSRTAAPPLEAPVPALPPEPSRPREAEEPAVEAGGQAGQVELDEDEEAAEIAEGPSEKGDKEEEERRRRRSRGRRGGRRRNGRAAAPAAEPVEEEDEEEEEPAALPVALPAALPATPRPLPVPLPAARREGYVISPGELESVSREIVITMPERRAGPDERKIALFCDLENIALGLRDSDAPKFDINLVLERLLEKGKIIVKKAYADWERYSDYKRPFHEAAIELIDIPQKFYSGKNSADIKMVVDAMDLSYSKEHLDTFVLLSGDSDFSPLVSKLKENNKYVIGIGVKNSSSNLLVGNCDEFIYYEDVRRDTEKAPKLDGLSKKTSEVFSLLVESIQALLRENKDVLWGSMIKQTMQRKKPSFNEGYYGYSTFSELLEDSERRGILKLKKDQRSGTYIVTGFAKSGEAAAARR